MFYRLGRKRSIWFALLAAILLVISGCSPTAYTQGSAQHDSADKQVIRIGYQKGNTLNILKVKGNLEERLKEQNIAVEWKLFAGGGQVLEALSSGSIDYGHAADGSGVFAQAGNQPIVYVGSDLPNPEGIGIMVHADAGITRIQDLKGKKIGVSKGGNHHYLAVLALERAGLAINDVEWVFGKDASQLRALFETRQVDAIGSWDPFFATVETDLRPLTLTNGQGYTPNPTFYYANPQFAKEHPELIKIILEETHKSDQWANQNKPEVTKLLAQTLGIDPKAIELAVSRRQYGVVNISPQVIAAQQQLADTYARIGLIEKPINVAEIMPIDPPWLPDLPGR